MTDRLLLILAAIATNGTLLAALPDPAEPTIIAIGATLGAFVGNTLARVRGREPNERTQASVEGGYYGTAAAVVAYLLANALGLS